jgi:hypothetical protein
VKFQTLGSLRPGSQFNLMLHDNLVTVSTTEAGDYTVSMPVWMAEKPGADGAQFGIVFGCWPGPYSIYIEEISLVRPD